MKILIACLGYLCSLAGLSGFIGVAMALLDPMGTQLANDIDPFGVHPAMTELWLIGAASLAILGLGAWLVFRFPASRGSRRGSDNWAQ